jgi:hypothetical protein
VPYISADAVELLRQLVGDVAELKSMMIDARRGVLSGADAALLYSVFSVAGSRLFTARELIAMSCRPGTPELALSALLAGRSAKAVGKMLSRAAGQPTPEGLSLVSRPGRTGCTWQVTHAFKAALR